MPDYSRHGHAKTQEYRSWQGMIQRCHNPNNTAFGTYGARGVAVCDAWRDNFANFWADMGSTWAPGLTLDRKDNDLGYFAENCRWVPKSEQGKNRRCCIFVDSPWGTLSTTDAAKRVGMSHPAFWQRYKKGLRGSALFAPPADKGSRVRPLTRDYLASREAA